MNAGWSDIIKRLARIGIRLGTIPGLVYFLSDSIIIAIEDTIEFPYHQHRTFSQAIEAVISAVTIHNGLVHNKLSVSLKLFK